MSTALERTSRSARPTSYLSRFALPAVLLVLILVFGLWRPEYFFTSTNLSAIITQQGIAVLAALAVTVALSAGEFDMSVGNTIGISAVTVAWALGAGAPLPASIGLGLLASLLVGAVNVLLIVVWGLGSFIATLGVGFILAGLALMITNGSPLYAGIPDEFTAFTSQQALGVPVLGILILGIAALLWLFLERTPAGRYLRAAGTGREAARLIGVPVDRYVVVALLLSALVGGVAGVLFVSNNGAVPATAGTVYTLPAYAAAFLGATALLPVRYNVLGTVLGAAVLSVGGSGLALIGAPFWVPQVFNGLALLVALLVTRTITRKEAT